MCASRWACCARIRHREAEIDAVLTPIGDVYALLSRYQVRVPKEETDTVSELRFGWGKMKTLAISVNDNLSRLQSGVQTRPDQGGEGVCRRRRRVPGRLGRSGPAVPGLSPVEAVDRLKKFTQMFEVRARKWRNYCSGEELFGLPVTSYPEMERTEKEIGMLTRLYDLYTNVLSTIDNYADILWTDVVANIDQMSEQVSQFQAQCKKLPKALRDWPAYTDCRKKIDDFLEILPLLQALSSPDMRDRHWASSAASPASSSFSGGHVQAAGFARRQHVARDGEIEDLTTGAIKEAQVETKLGIIDEDWADQEFVFGPYKSRGTSSSRWRLHRRAHREAGGRADGARVDGDKPVQRAVQRRRRGLDREVKHRVRDHRGVADRAEHVDVHGGGLLRRGPPVKQLPLEAEGFNNIDKTFMKAVAGAVDEANVVAVCCGSETMLNTLPHLTEQLELCQKGLTAFLDNEARGVPALLLCLRPHAAGDFVAQERPAGGDAALPERFVRLAR